jgi:hypothetical protein
LKTGFKAVIGSWNTIEMRAPRIERMSFSSIVTRLFPSNWISLPGSIRPGGRTRRRRESAVTDLPHPDSPTSPTVSPDPISKLTPSTARATPPSV